jgi:hypothetical protein
MADAQPSKSMLLLLLIWQILPQNAQSRSDGINQYRTHTQNCTLVCQQAWTKHRSEAFLNPARHTGGTTRAASNCCVDDTATKLSNKRLFGMMP